MRENEEEKVYQTLFDNYRGFLKVVLANPDLYLFTTEQKPELSAEQRAMLPQLLGGEDPSSRVMEGVMKECGKSN